MSDNKIILIGYSGHGLVLADVAYENNLYIKGYTEKTLSNSNPFNLEYLGDETDSEFIGWNLNIEFIIGVGDNYIRERIFNLVKAKNKNIRRLLSTSALISKTAKIGEGTFVNKNVVVNAFSQIGNNVILNTSCIIEHQCDLSNSVHVGPGAVLLGNVRIGERSFIGANSVIKQGITIGNDVIIGAGSVIINNVQDGLKIVGNPGRII